MSQAARFIAVIGLFVVVGCGRQEPAPAARTEQVSEASTGGHAAGVVAGSYEDWCEEHQVPETQCTRCDASLIPAFQAVGDWDADHGLPMSQCTIHDPELKIVRPPKPEGQ